jgi:HEAT repeat protein
MAEAMLRLDGNHVTATDSLVGLLSASDPEVRMLAAFAMQSATTVQRPRCISTLIRVLEDTDSEVRAAAALTLGGYGSSAKAALPVLVRLVHDENVDTARAAGVALQCISPPSAAATQVDTRVTPVAAGVDHGK